MRKPHYLASYMKLTEGMVIHCNRLILSYSRNNRCCFLLALIAEVQIPFHNIDSWFGTLLEFNIALNWRLLRLVRFEHYASYVISWITTSLDGLGKSTTPSTHVANWQSISHFLFSRADLHSSFVGNFTFANVRGNNWRVLSIKKWLAM